MCASHGVPQRQSAATVKVGHYAQSVQPQASSSSLLTVLRASDTGTRWMATVKGYCYAIGYLVEAELAARVGRESGGER